MKRFFLISILVLLVSGCLSAPEPRFNLDGTERLDFNPISFEALKLWNRSNLTTQEVQLDACNKAVRIDSYTWQITVSNC